MPYATTAELADALRITATAANQAALTACLEAAAIEINDALCEPADVAPNALLNRVNLVRAVEWWKANDAAVGSPAGSALAAPVESFAGHSADLTPLKTTFGIA